MRALHEIPIPVPKRKSSFDVETILFKSETTERERNILSAEVERTANDYRCIEKHDNDLLEHTCDICYYNHESVHTDQKRDFRSDHTSARRRKTKRMRTIFSSEQLKRLETEFLRQQYIVGSERLLLASTLNLTESQVKVWFQNRRIKWRKQNVYSTNNYEINMSMFDQNYQLRSQSQQT